MKKYKGQRVYDSMDNLPFLDESISLRRTGDADLIARCIEYLKEKGQE